MFKAVQAGADAHAVPSATRETRMCRCEPAAWRRDKGKGGVGGVGVGRGPVWPSMQVARLELAECVLCMWMYH